MRLELAERLRCPGAHAPTPLVVVAARTADRELVEGFAGCPVCHLEARITDGDVWFPSAEADADADADAAGEPGREPASPTREEPAGERVVRTAALLGLAEPGGAVLLGGAGYAALAAALAESTGVSVVVLGAAQGDGVSAVHAPHGAVPFGDQTFRAAALDAVSADAVRAVVVGGHILAPAAAARPAGLTELARDAAEWVARREAPPVAVPLTRAPRR